MRPNVRLIYVAIALSCAFLWACEEESTPTTPEVTPNRQLLTYRYWHPASPPAFPDGSVLAANSQQAIIWYNIEPSLGASKRDFYPSLSKDQDGYVVTLDLELLEPPADPTNWAGIMTGFPEGTQGNIAPLDLSDFTFLDIWINDFRPDPNDRKGLLYIDLGFIDEDFFEPENDEWNDEDQEQDGFAPVWDDTGLDGMFNINPDAVKNNPGIIREEENPGGTDPNVDIHGDDYDPNRIAGRFTKINGTEYNRIHDTEDLDGSNQLDDLNAYFRYEIDLSATADTDIRRDYPNYDGFDDPDHESDSWRLYRIPLSDYAVVSTNGRIPYRDEITHVRIWADTLTDVFSASERIQIGRFKPTN